MSSSSAFLISPIRRVFCRFAENGMQKQQQLQIKLNGNQAGNNPEEKDTISPRVVPVWCSIVWCNAVGVWCIWVGVTNLKFHGLYQVWFILWWEEADTGLVKGFQIQDCASHVRNFENYTHFTTTFDRETAQGPSIYLGVAKWLVITAVQMPRRGELQLAVALERLEERRGGGVPFYQATIGCNNKQAVQKRGFHGTLGPPNLASIIKKKKSLPGLLINIGYVHCYIDTPRF